MSSLGVAYLHIILYVPFKTFAIIVNNIKYQTPGEYLCISTKSRPNLTNNEFRPASNNSKQSIKNRM